MHTIDLHQIKFFQEKLKSKWDVKLASSSFLSTLLRKFPKNDLYDDSFLGYLWFCLKNNGKTIKEPTGNLTVWRISNHDIELTANIRLTCMENLLKLSGDYSKYTFWPEDQYISHCN